MSSKPLNKGASSREWHEILVMALGTTPQIVTETLWALLHLEPPLIPDRIRIVTTTRGRDLALQALVTEGQLADFNKDWRRGKGCTVDKNTFILARRPDGTLLDDIRSAADNELLADTIASLVREETEDPASRLHCSIAGGRKTMSFYLGAALQICGYTELS